MKIRSGLESNHGSPIQKASQGLDNETAVCNWLAWSYVHLTAIYVPKGRFKAIVTDFRISSKSRNGLTV